MALFFCKVYGRNAGNRRIDKDNGVKLRIHNGTQVNFRTMMSRLKVFLIDKYRKASYVKR